MKKFLIFVLIIMLTFSLTSFSFAKTQMNSKETLREKIIKYSIESGKRWNVDPAFLLAVFYIESRKLNKHGKVLIEFRTGWIGKPVRKNGRIICPGRYAGPAAIYYGCMNKYGIKIYEIDRIIDLAAKTLNNVGDNPSLQKRKLRKYNAEFKNSYFHAIRQATKKFRYELYTKKNL